MKTAVVKLSGKAIEDFITNPDWLKAIRKLHSMYDGLIIVHGAGSQISEWTTALGGENNFINGQRVTDEFSMNVVAAVQAGIINSRIVGYLCSRDLNAVGLTGIDNNLFVADYSDNRLGFVGVPKLNKNISWLNEMMLAQTIPVFSSICRDKAGNLMNVNADIFTNILASSLNAETVYFVSDVKGVVLDGKIKNEICEKEVVCGIRDNQITGGMIPKLESCVSLLKSGVNKVWIGNSPLDFSASQTDGKGTWIVSELSKSGQKKILKYPVPKILNRIPA
jgi:acetylglutamate kinase